MQDSTQSNGQDRYRELAARLQEGTITPDERKEYAEWMQAAAQDGEPIELPPEFAGSETELKDRIFFNVNKQISKGKVVPFRKKWIRVASVAAVLLLMATGAWLYFKPTQNHLTAGTIVLYKNDVTAPAITKATLTIGNGKQIVLDNMAKGSLAPAGATGASKTGQNALAYDGSALEVEYHTLTNPRGSKAVQLTLPDGSIAWLNAGSSIMFPTVFKGPERIVTMTGEAYFEVKHNASHPFKVNAGGQVIEDIGTAFNVNAYGDEAIIKTTLVEGSVKVSAGKSTPVFLVPNQQAQTGKKGGIRIEKMPDMQQTLAWKEDQFYFDGNSVESILQQAARWYNVEVVYTAKINEGFTMKLDRNVPISNLLRYMERSGGVHFEIEGNKVTVKP